MNVRTASFRDLGRIEQIHREAIVEAERDGVLPAISGESPVPQTALVRLWYAVSKTLTSLVPTVEPGAALLVVEDDDGRVVGFVQAASVSGQPKTWHIVNLCLVPQSSTAGFGPPLLAQLCNQGLTHGVTRFSVRIPVDHPLVGLFVDQGFVQYATEQILFRDDSDGPPRILGDERAGVLRPARRDDIPGIYHLYLRTTPSHVTGLEGPSLKVWQASFHQGLVSRLGRDDVRHFVAEHPGIVAWVAIRPAVEARPMLLSVMCEGQDGELRDAVLDAALRQVPVGPVSCVLRHYDSELIRALQRRGFEILGSQLLLVRDLAQKAKMRAAAGERRPKVSLAHAGLMRVVADPVVGRRSSPPPVTR